MTSNEEAINHPRRVPIEASVTFGSLSATAALGIISADDVVVEDSQTLKYLRLRNGDYSCYKSVFLVLEGERHEITVDELPREQE